jgi:hypothetical protein
MQETFMKIALIILLMGQLSFAQTMKEKRTKEEMLNRVELLISKIEETRKDLKQEDVVSACSKIKEMFAIYPEHVMDVGIHMDLLRGKVNNVKSDALSQLIFMHRQTLICEKGTDCEYIDPKAVGKSLKEIERSLKKQRRVIKNSSTGHNNSFEYRYEF